MSRDGRYGFHGWGETAGVGVGYSYGFSREIRVGRDIRDGLRLHLYGFHVRSGWGDTLAGGDGRYGFNGLGETSAGVGVGYSCGFHVEIGRVWHVFDESVQLLIL